MADTVTVSDRKSRWLKLAEQLAEQADRRDHREAS